MTSVKLEYSRGEVIAEKFEIIDLLDESPLGFTYRVKHLEKGSFLRLLLVRPELATGDKRGALVEAAKRTRSIKHRNLLKFGELGEHSGVAYVAMEDFEGSSLRELLQEYKIAGKQFDLKEAAQVTVLVLEALTALHQGGVIVRALRPEYVLINVRYAGPRQANFVAQVKIFGGAFWELVPAGTLAEDEFTRGEAQYLAPELKTFQPDPNERCDIYSAGVILYEMLTGTAPIGTFQQPTQIRSDLPRHVNDVVELALANAPEDRYRTAADTIADIQRIFNQDEMGEPEAERRPLIPPLWFGLAMIVVLAVAVILYQLRPNPVEEAKTLDAELRLEMKQKIAIPTADEVAAKLENQPPNMLWIPAGPYISGRMHSEVDAPSFEPLAQVVEVDHFLIDALEYPNLEGAQPYYNVTFAESEQLCADGGKRLCTAQEWEKACKGPGQSIYAYGDFYDPAFCGEGLEERGYEAGVKKECRGKLPIFDMSGNFREWTSSMPPGKDTRRIVKGGLRHNAERGTRCAFSVDESTGFRDGSMSFRCCRDVDAPPWTPPAEEGEGDEGKAP